MSLSAADSDGSDDDDFLWVGVGCCLVFWWFALVLGWWWWVFFAVSVGVGVNAAAWTNLSLFSLSQQREQQDKAAEMGHRFPGRAGRQPHWSLMLMELLQAANMQPEITPKKLSATLTPKHRQEKTRTTSWEGFHTFILIIYPKFYSINFKVCFRWCMHK